MGKYQKRLYYGTLKEAGRPKYSCINRSSRKRLEPGKNQCSWQLIDRSGKNLETTYVPKGTMDPITIITIIILVNI